MTKENLSGIGIRKTQQLDLKVTKYILDTMQILCNENKNEIKVSSDLA